MFEEYVNKKVKIVWEEGEIRFLKGLLLEVDEEHGLLKIEGLRDGRAFTIKYDSPGFRSISPIKEGGKRV